ncbi:MAG TPA: hypothetical protein VGD66_00200 [Allosphingosinicella sp.]|jgi:hypothetical protein
MNLPILVLHVAAGSGALVTGGTALAVPKGGVGHVRAGTLFVAAMLLMTSAGAALAIVKPDRITTMAGVFAAYLVLTSWWTARGDGKAGRFEQAAFLAGVAIATLCCLIGSIGLSAADGRVDDLPGAVAFVFGGVAALAASLDLNFLLRGRLQPRQRIARHLWRMCAALLIAAMSFFIGQQKVMPPFVRGSPFLFLPPLGILAAMIFWIFRTRFPRRPRPPALLSAEAQAEAAS